jgi:lipopolysaccharide biosynthesis regulator YciM
MVANHQVAVSEPVLAHMRSNGVELTPYIANTLIHGWAAEKKIEKAQGIYDAVGREKREPSTYEAMTRAFLAVEQREQAKGVVGEMLTRGYPSAVVNKVLELLGGGHDAA